MDQKNHDWSKYRKEAKENMLALYLLSFVILFFVVYLILYTVSVLSVALN